MKIQWTRHTFYVLTLVFAFTLGRQTDSLAEQGIEFPVPTKEFVVTVTDDSGKPIKGATVRADKIRPVESPGGWSVWPEKNVGPAPIVKTDGNGRASFRYPVRFGQPPDWFHPKILIYKVEHAEYIKEFFEHEVDSSPVTASMDRGCELIVSAVDPSRQSILNLGVLVAGNHVQFVPGDGASELRSRAIPHGKRQVMLVGPDKKNGKHLFGAVRVFDFGDSRRVTMRGLMLKPGMEMSGHLSKNVPRPIKHGCVIAFCQPMPTDGNKRDENVRWCDAVPIREDGSFVFPSLPSTGELKLIAVCDGWVIDGETDGLFQRGIAYDVEKQPIKDNRWIDVTIPMLATTSAKFIVRDIDGNAIQGAKVSSSPNQQTEFGAQVLGRIYPTVDFLNQPIPSVRKRNPMDRSKQRYVAVTNDVGIVVLPDLPTGTQFVQVTHEDYRLKRDRALGLGKQIKLDKTKQNVFDIQMVPVKDQKPR